MMTNDQADDWSPMRPPRLHIAVVTETWPPEVNGVARTIATMVDGMRARGHRISLTRPRQYPRDRESDSQNFRERLVTALPLPGYPSLRFGLPAAHALRAAWLVDRPDIVQVVTEGPLGASAVTAAQRLGIPVVTEFHTHFDAYSGYYRMGWLQRIVAAHLMRLHRRSNATLVPTAELAASLSARGVSNPQVVARGIDTRRFNPQARNAALRATWGASNDTPVVAYVGRVAAEKNLALVFDAFDAIARRVPSARLLIVGDGPARASWQARYPQHLFAGMRSGTDLAAHYASADLFLFPSLTETYGNVTLEALASGLPVVAYRQAAAAEVIASGENGYVATPGDAADFIRAAVALAAAPVASPDWRARIVASVAHLSWDAIFDTLESTLRMVIARQSPYRPMPRALPLLHSSGGGQP